MLRRRSLLDFFIDSVLYPEVYYIPRKAHRCKNGECRCKKNKEEKSFAATPISWTEETNNWYMTINAPDADIRVDEGGLDVSYEYEEKVGNATVHKKSKFFVTYPSNSKTDTLKAKRLGEKAILVTIDKEVVDEPKDTRKRLTIE